MNANIELSVQDKIKRLGRLLWIIGMIGVAIEIMTLAYDLIVPWQLDKQFGHIPPSIIYSSLFLSYLFPLMAMQSLGRRLMREEALSLPVADAFRRIGHSTLLFALFQGIPDFINGFIDGFNDGTQGMWTMHFSPLAVGYFSDLYLPIIASLCLYSVAHLMKLAAQAADDSRSII